MSKQKNSKEKTLKIVAGVLSVSTLSMGVGFMNGTSDSVNLNEYQSSSIVTHSLVMGGNECSDVKYRQIMNNGSGSSHITNDEMRPIISVENNHIDYIVEQFISLIQIDREDDNSFESSKFINRQYEENANNCIQMIKIAFAIESYQYAREVISAIRFSDIDYLQKWFKELLLNGKHQPKLANYINALFELYREELDAL